MERLSRSCQDLAKRSMHHVFPCVLVSLPCVSMFFQDLGKATKIRVTGQPFKAEVDGFCELLPDELLLPGFISRKILATKSLIEVTQYQTNHIYSGVSEPLG